VAYHPEGKLIAVGERDGVAIHDATTGKVVHRFVGHRGIVRRLAFTPDGHHLVSGGNDGSLLVWDMSGVTIR
jgi:WD40 repeat protein